MKHQTILYLLSMALLCGCGRQGPNLQGHWVIDVEPTKQLLQKSSQWTGMSERERKMMEPMMFGLLDDMHMHFDKELCTVTMGQLEQKTPYTIKSREEQRLILESDVNGQPGRITIDFPDPDRLIMSSDLQEHMNLYIWKRVD